MKRNKYILIHGIVGYAVVSVGMSGPLFEKAMDENQNIRKQ